MFKDKVLHALYETNEKHYLEIVPPHEDEIEYIKNHSPKALGIDVLTKPLPDYDYLFENGHGNFIGTRAIEKSFGDFFHSNIGKTISEFCEAEGYEKVSAYMTGRTASDAVEQTITYGAFSWIAALNGLTWTEPTDIDIYVSKELFKKVKKTHTGKEILCRSVDIALYEITEKVGGKEIKVQVHCAVNSDLDPLQSASLLAPTELHAAGIAFQGANLVTVDPFGTLKKGPHEQSFPNHLFDKRNKLAEGSVRAVSGALIYLFATPLPQAPSNPEKVREEISRVLTTADNSQITSVLEKVVKWSGRVPYDDFPYYDTDNQRVTLLFDLGFFPHVINRALTLYEKDRSEKAYEAINLLLYKVICARSANGPRPEHLQLPEEDIYNQFSEEERLALAKEISASCS